MTTRLTLNNGVELPGIGLGVFQSSPEETVDAVDAALRAGYRHIDTAAAYFNERQVGEGIRKSGVDREEIFLESKIWITDYGYDSTLHAFEKATGKLGFDTLDLLILHQPLPNEFEDTIAAYRALETLVKDGKVRAIGVSNFRPVDLDLLLAETTVVPAVNQIEIHPYVRNTPLLEKNAELGILSQAWSPIGGITFYPVPWEGERRSTLTDPTLVAIGEAHGKSTAQVMLRWHLQQGRSAIPKSITPSRIVENFDVFDFELSDAELASIDALDTGGPGTSDPTTVTRENFGWEIPEA